MKTKIITDIKNEFERKYAFNNKKDANDIYLGFDVQDLYYKKLYKNFLSEISLLSKNIQGGQNIAYNELIKSDLYIYGVEPISIKYQCVNLEGNNILTENEYGLNYNYTTENKDIVFSGQDLQDNNYDAIISRYYHGIVDNFPIINLGGYLVADRKKETKELVNAIQCTNIESPIYVKNRIKIKTKSFENILKQIKENKDNQFLYSIDYIGSGYTTEDPTLMNEFGIDEKTDLDCFINRIDYFYIEKFNILIPLLRFDCNFAVDYGKETLSFWTWILDE